MLLQTQNINLIKIWLELTKNGQNIEEYFNCIMQIHQLHNEWYLVMISL